MHEEKKGKEGERRGKGEKTKKKKERNGGGKKRTEYGLRSAVGKEKLGGVGVGVSCEGSVYSYGYGDTIDYIVYYNDLRG